MHRFEFLTNLDTDLKTVLMNQFRDLWTHSSTAIEGNTLSLGDTAFVLSEGLTVAGKPLKDHQEVVGHARAIDILYDLAISDKPMTKEMLFDLHKTIQTEIVLDVYRPTGDWKKEPNSTSVVLDGKHVVFDYSAVRDIPCLMETWLEHFRKMCAQKHASRQEAVLAYAKAHISFALVHPFADGNGRMARLVSNIPVLKSGLPPIIIPTEKRQKYIDLLARHHLFAGQIKPGKSFEFDSKSFEAFVDFCSMSWECTWELISKVWETQNQRNK